MEVLIMISWPYSNVSKISREKSFKGQKDAAKATFLFFTTPLILKYHFFLKSWFTACLSLLLKLVWSEESCITNSAYTAHSTSQPWPRIFSYRVCRKCDMYHPVYFPPRKLHDFKIARKKSGQKKISRQSFLRTLHLWLCMTFPKINHRFKKKSRPQFSLPSSHQCMRMWPKSARTIQSSSNKSVGLPRKKKLSKMYFHFFNLSHFLITFQHSLMYSFFQASSKWRLMLKMFCHSKLTIHDRKYLEVILFQ